MDLMNQPFRLLSFEYTPSSPLAQSLLETLFDTLALERSHQRSDKSRH